MYQSIDESLIAREYNAATDIEWLQERIDNSTMVTGTAEELVGASNFDFDWIITDSSGNILKYTQYSYVNENTLLIMRTFDSTNAHSIIGTKIFEYIKTILPSIKYVAILYGTESRRVVIKQRFPNVIDGEIPGLLRYRL